MGALENLIKWMQSPNPEAVPLPDLPDHRMVYIQSLLREKFNREYSYLEIEVLLREEGLLTKEQGIPLQNKFIPKPKV